MTAPLTDEAIAELGNPDPIEFLRTRLRWNESHCRECERDGRDSGSAPNEAAGFHAAIDEIERLRALTPPHVLKLIEELEKLRAQPTYEDGPLPEEVRLTGLVIKAGCSISSLLEAIKVRCEIGIQQEGRDPDLVLRPEQQTFEDGLRAAAKVAERFSLADLEYGRRYTDELEKMIQRSHRAQTIAAAILALIPKVKP